MRHTPDKLQALRRTEFQKPALKPLPEDKSKVLTDILEGLEALKFADVGEARRYFMEEYTALFIERYDVKQYWDRYVRWRDAQARSD